MKILHIKNVAHVGENIVSGLRQIGVDAELYETIKINKNHLPKIIKKTVGLCIAIYELIRFNLFIKNKDFNVFHIHYGPMAYLGLFSHIPFYLHFHGTDLREAINRPIEGWFIKKGIKAAKAVFYSTPDLEKCIKIYRQDALFIPNPIDVYAIEKKYSEPNGKKSDLFSISKIDRNKGIDIIFETIRMLIKELPDIKILMYGFGNTIDNFSTDMIRFYGDKQIEVLKAVDHHEVFSLINNTKIVLGQISVGFFGVSELEAMACGRPVICRFWYESIYPSAPPVISVESANEALEKIIFLMNHPKIRREIGLRSKEWVKKYHESKVIANKLLEIYQEEDFPRKKSQNE
jgi:glycosyltransferase involved in cell wall biosynthesis